MSDPSQSARRQRLLSSADQCVKCGLCLPHCPTYRATRRESESPRGRIALIQGLALGALKPDARVQAHLDSCLTCRACETACPAKVRYGELIDLGREELAAQRQLPPPRRRRALLETLSRPRRMRTAAWAVYAYRRSGLQRLLRGSGLLRRLGLARLDNYLGPLEAPRAFAPLYPARGPLRGRVGLFTGCVGAIFDRRALQASIEVLTRLGYEVSVPAAQGCCGALFAHAGNPARARELAQQNLAAFADPALDAVLYVASGCGSQLSEYPKQLADSLATAQFAERVQEISAFLLTCEWPESVRLAPLPARAVVHDPCTLRNVVKGAQAPYALLARIPALAVEPLAGNGGCCGAAGSFMLEQPAMADRLREPKLDAAAKQQADLLLTSNIGCALHLAAGLRARTEGLKVMHPVELLARQWV